MKEAAVHGLEAPSPWVQRWSHLVKPGGLVLDVACGYGRHARWFYERNHPLALIDRSHESSANLLAFLSAESTAKKYENQFANRLAALGR